MSTNSPLMVDPPEGWRYGFPKAYFKNRVGSDRELRSWLLHYGYPAKMIDSLGPKMRGIRFIGGE